MEKIKNFVTNHKKAIVIGAVIVGTVAVGAIAYKLHMDNVEVLEKIADVAEEIDQTVVEAATNL